LKLAGRRVTMLANDVTVGHGAWADGSSWVKVIGPLAAESTKVAATRLPPSSFGDDVAALRLTLARLMGLLFSPAIVTATGVVVELIREAVRDAVAGQRPLRKAGHDARQ
jgi:hypothetical protein